MGFKLAEAADSIGGKIIGDKTLVIKNLARIEEAKEGDLTFLYLPAYQKYFKATKASAILVKTGFEKTRNDITYIEVEDPSQAFSRLVVRYFSPEFFLSGIDKSASIHPSAEIGKNAAIGKNVVISSGCKVGENTKIFHNTVLLENVEIGSNTVLFQNVSIRENCKIGSNNIIHPNTVVGSDGFGFFRDSQGVYQKIPQIGNVILQDKVELGSNVSIDRAALGSTVIGKGVKIDNLVQIAHNVTIGENTVISSQTGISGSTKIGKGCIIAGQVGIVGHIEVTDNVVVLAKSGISKNITKPGYYYGVPVKELKVSRKLEAHVRSLPDYVDKIKELERQVELLKKEVGELKEKP
jgi:UDP-3-O-[3-hydroxymyristoyl] glucosamine N-acyltransferase